MDYSLMLLLPLCLLLSTSPIPLFHYLPALTPLTPPTTSPPFSLGISYRPFILYIFPSLCCVTFHSSKTLSRLCYPEPLTQREAYVPLFFASFNLYSPSGRCAALSSPPHLALLHLQITLGKSSSTTKALLAAERLRWSVGKLSGDDLIE